MVKALLSILITAALLAGACVFEHQFVKASFDQIALAVETLREKVDKETATSADGEAVQTLWEEQKKKLHIVIPHNDISYVDYWIAEAVGCIQTQDYREAHSKLEVLVTVCKQIPATYHMTAGNVL